ncbi:MAG: oligogalacturonate lyase family protein, partial [Balneolaceae bacterium]
TGLNQMYRMDVESGDSAQLTYFSDYRPRPIVHPDGLEAYFRAAGAKVWATDIESGRTRQVVDASNLTNENRLHGLSLSGDGKRLLITYFRKQSDDMALALADTDGTTKPEEVFVFEYHPVRGEVNRIGHPQFCPTDDNLVSCVKLPDHQGGWPVERKSIDLPDEMRARTWLVDLQAQESRPLIVTPAGHRATHEYWSPDGSKMFYHQKTVPGFVPASIKSVNLDRTEVKTYIESESIKLGHSAVNHDETKIVSDSQEPNLNELLLIDIATGDYEILCWPNTSGDGQVNHTHPNFSRNGNMIIYTSDATGFAQVYLIDLREGN